MWALNVITEEMFVLQLGWIRNFVIPNFVKCRQNFVESYKISPYEILYFCKILVKFHYRKIFFPTSHTLCYSIEHIKLKLFLFSKLPTNFAVQNFGEILKNLCLIL
jgi:hypothetical protein